MKRMFSVLTTLSAIFLLTNLGFAVTTPATSGLSHKVQTPNNAIIRTEGTSIYDDPVVFDGLITQNFTADVGRDGAGNALPVATGYWDGRDIFSTGVDMDFSSPDAPDPSLVTVSSGHPELGPVGPGNEFWCGALRYDFDVDIIAVGFGTHVFGPVQIILLNRDGSQLSTTAWPEGGNGFIGIIDNRGFAAVILDTDSCFWSMDEVRGQATNPLKKSLTISPPSGKFVTTQKFDLALIVESPGLSVVGGSAELDGSDVTSALASCVIPGTLASGGQTFRCPALTGGFLGTGIHTLSVNLNLSDSSAVTDTVTWEVEKNTEP